MLDVLVCKVMATTNRMIFCNDGFETHRYPGRGYNL